jgi:hypothetical protein
MSLTLRSTAPAALLVAGIVVVSSTSGAVAGAMITGKNIKDGTVTSADIKNLSLRSSDTSNELDLFMRRVSGYSVVQDSEPVAGGANGVLTVACPDGTNILGTTAWWESSYQGVQAEPVADGDYATKARTYATNPGAGTDVVHLVAYCGRTAG